jgi:hypothetical protein
MYKSLIESESVDIICTVETWLDNNINDDEISLPTHNSFRKDRLGRGGGLLLAVRNNIPCILRPDLLCNNDVFNEIIVCEIQLHSNCKIAVIAFYRPPNSDANFNNNISQTLNNVINAGYKKFLVLGDLNAPSIMWDSLTSNNKLDNDLCEIFSDCNFTQINSNPSRHNSQNILDVILTNCPNLFSDVHSSVSMVKTDHFQLNFTIKGASKSTKEDVGFRTVYSFRDVNFDQLSFYISLIDLNNIILNNQGDLDLAWEKWKCAVINIIDKVVPKVAVKNVYKHPWVDAEVIHLSNQKETARRKAKASGKVNDWNQYRKLNNDVKKLVKTKYNEYLTNALENVNICPKNFWGLVNCKNNKKSLPDTMYYGDSCAKSSKDKACLFNQFFYNQFSKSDLPVPHVNQFVNDNLSSLILTHDEVLKALQGIKAHKAYNPDGIPPIVLKCCARTLTSSITLLFNLCLDLGYVPNKWKLANVVPIFKKGSREMVNNYRPVSLLTVISKVMERCIHSHVYAITRQDILSSQHGFMTSRSTTTQLLSFYDNIHQNVDSGGQVDVLYLDLSKAFDSVPHKLLINQLKSFGYSNKLLKFFHSYLSNRFQKVVVQGQESEYLPVLSGVPQGSILGPLLFLYYINNCGQNLSQNTNLSLYADDSKLSCQIKDINDCITLQNDLDSLVSWGFRHGMYFNPNKCSTMTFTRKSDAIVYDYIINGTSVSRVSKFTDLGIHVSDNLTWDHHIDICLKKANKRLGLIKRSLGYVCPTNIKILSYTSLVRPLVEHNSQIWSGCNKKYMVKLESLQRRATKFIVNNNTLSYDLRLNHCGLLPLSLRRDFLDCTFFYNCWHNLIDFNIDNLVRFVVAPNVRTRNIRDDLQLCDLRVKTEIYRKFFTHRIVSIWNSIPYEIRDLDLTPMGYNSMFKKALKQWFVNLFNRKFVTDDTCTWITCCLCSSCRQT